MGGTWALLLGQRAISSTLAHRCEVQGRHVKSKTRSLWLFVTVFSLAIVLAVYMVFILWFLPWL